MEYLDYNWGLNDQGSLGRNYSPGIFKGCSNGAARLTEMSALVMAFLKAPRPGTVKTRLGREIGMDEAAAVYRQLAEQQLRRIPESMRTEIHYAPRGAAGEMRTWLGGKLSYRAQSGGDLGKRMSHAFARGFKRGCQSIIAIGSDCPGLDEACLKQAADLLTKTDVVLGPASDGGYYLIGLRHPAPRLFEEIEWSTAAVLETTRLRIRECGLSYALLEKKEDIDELAALRRHLTRGTATGSQPEHGTPDLRANEGRGGGGWSRRS